MTRYVCMGRSGAMVGDSSGVCSMPTASKSWFMSQVWPCSLWVYRLRHHLPHSCMQMGCNMLHTAIAEKKKRSSHAIPASAACARPASSRPPRTHERVVVLAQHGLVQLALLLSQLHAHDLLHLGRQLLQHVLLQAAQQVRCQLAVQLSNLRIGGRAWRGRRGTAGVSKGAVNRGT